METLDLEIISIKGHTPDIKTFRLGLDKEVSFKPGQYLVLTLDVDGKDISKPLSISSSPTEKGYIEFTKKLTQSGFSAKLGGMRPGDRCSVRMPLGKFTFEGEFPRAAFLSGGIGITPIRSIFKYATDTSSQSSLILLYSGRRPGQLVFREDFETMSRENPNIKPVYTLTGCEKDAASCRRGRIDAEMIKEELPDYVSRKFYICGPPGMVKAMSGMLSGELGVKAEDIITEDFTGY